MIAVSTHDLMMLDYRVFFLLTVNQAISPHYCENCTYSHISKSTERFHFMDVGLYQMTSLL